MIKQKICTLICNQNIIKLQYLKDCWIGSSTDHWSRIGNSKKELHILLVINF